MNRLIKMMGVVLFILFLSLYLSKYNNDYYENRRVLTEEAMERFEKDMKNGKKINASNYLPKEKNYNNRVSKMGIESSKFIEKFFSKSLHFMMKYLDSIQSTAN